MIDQRRNVRFERLERDGLAIHCTSCGRVVEAVLGRIVVGRADGKDVVICPN
jgi:hypothetical protein